MLEYVERPMRPLPKMQVKVKQDIACIACARAKTKCDKLLPRCSRCVKKNINCEHRTMRRRGKSPIPINKRLATYPGEAPATYSTPGFQSDHGPHLPTRPKNYPRQRKAKTTHHISIPIPIRPPPGVVFTPSPLEYVWNNSYETTTTSSFEAQAQEYVAPMPDTLHHPLASTPLSPHYPLTPASSGIVASPTDHAISGPPAQWLPSLRTSGFLPDDMTGRDAWTQSAADQETVHAVAPIGMPRPGQRNPFTVGRNQDLRGLGLYDMRPVSTHPPAESWSQAEAPEFVLVQSSGDQPFQYWNQTVPSLATVHGQCYH